MNAEVVIVRHADTDWSASGRHTGRTDIGLNDAGRARAASLRTLLAAQTFDLVLSSPLSRALETANLAGFTPEVRDELLEWDYGTYEGLTTAQIRERRPGWSLWRDGCPGGEHAADVGRRADALLATLPPGATVLLFSHGHLLRVLIARWLDLPPANGALFVLRPAGISGLGHEREQRVLLALTGAGAAPRAPAGRTGRDH